MKLYQVCGKDINYFGYTSPYEALNESQEQLKFCEIDGEVLKCVNTPHGQQYTFTKIYNVKYYSPYQYILKIIDFYKKNNEMLDIFVQLQDDIEYDGIKHRNFITVVDLNEAVQKGYEYGIPFAVDADTMMKIFNSNASLCKRIRYVYYNWKEYYNNPSNKYI